jgi:hypothetical protein
MLQKGLYVCSAEMVFKVIESLKVEYLVGSAEQMAKPLIANLANSLINIWNSQIQHAEFQFFPDNLKQMMVQLNEAHSSKPPIVFGVELLNFYHRNAVAFIEVENKKQ